jgi:hypothetical protein
MPHVADDSATTSEDVAITIDVLANDAFEDPARELTSFSFDAQGWVARDPGGTRWVPDGWLTRDTNGTATLTDDRLIYTPSSDFNGVDTFTYTVTPPNGPAETATLTITVNAVQDIVDDTATTNEDGEIHIDVLANDAFEYPYRTPNGYTQGAHGSVFEDFNFSWPLFDDKLVYIPNADFNGPDSFTYTVASGGVTETATVNVTVNAVNDAPVNSVPSAQSVNEDSDLAIAGLAISDVDSSSGTLTTTLSVAHGTLTVGPAGGATVTGSGTSSITLTGTVAQINTTLSAAGNVSYRGSQDYNGPDTLTLVTNDGGNTGTGGAKNDTDTVGITVLAVNDAPVFAGFGTTHTSATEQTFVRLDGGATVSDVELDALNGGAGDYKGASVIIGRAGSPVPNPEDTFFFGGAGMAFGVDNVNHVLLSGGLQFATFNIPTSGALAGTIAVNFNSLNTIATSALVDNVLGHITYENQSDTPPASVTMHWTFNDGNFGGLQGSGGNLSDTANRVIDITAVNDALIITSDGGGDTANVSVVERTAAVTTVVAADPDGPTLSYSIVGGADAAKFQIDSATGALSFITAPNFDIPADADHNNSYIVQVRASDGSLTDDQTITVNVTDNPNVTSTVHWTQSVDISPHPAGWAPAGIGDFNVDGTADLAWFNATTGDLDIWKLQNGQWASSADVGSHPAGYQPARTGDFNHDGTSDISWYNPTTRDVDIWKIVSGQWTGSSDVGSHPAGYVPALAGDFNGDGTNDIAWVNPTTNDLDIWKIANGQWAGSSDVGSHPAGYVPVLAGDFNGDGSSDIAWYNPTTNDIDIWKLSNGQWAGSVDVGSHPAGWQPLGAADFNLDGTSDIAWYNPTINDIDIWVLKNGQWAGSVDVGTHPAGAVAVGVGDFDHNGVSDIMWRDTSTGHLDNWMLAYS